jgi:hypothetical protein
MHLFCYSKKSAILNPMKLSQEEYKLLCELQQNENHKKIR